MLLPFLSFSLTKHGLEGSGEGGTGYFPFLFIFSWKHSRAVRCRVVKRCRVVTPFWSCTSWGGSAFYSWAYCFSHSRRALSIASLELWRRALSAETFKKVSRLERIVCLVCKKGWWGEGWQNAGRASMCQRASWERAVNLNRATPVSAIPPSWWSSCRDCHDWQPPIRRRCGFFVLLIDQDLFVFVDN